jgi:hypothetical protein
MPMIAGQTKKGELPGLREQTKSKATTKSKPFSFN